MMNTTGSANHPRVVERKCGGWLATSPVGAVLCVGVTASTEAEVRAKYSHSLKEWIDLVSDDFDKLASKG